ncbi:MAG: YbaK/EbsC family protein [Chloroflexi bacterium]|nr:YbaK/EbsC family protein [Chloroflexota bacterium]
MGVKDVQAALAKINHDTKVVEFGSSTATSQEAAGNVGCQLGQIVKSLGFMVNKSTPVLVLASGDQTIDERKLAAIFGVGRKKVRMMTAAQCLDLLGYAPGGVPPLAHRRTVDVYLDDTLRRFQTVYAAGGAANAIFPIELETLQAMTSGTFVDLARA